MACKTCQKAAQLMQSAAKLSNANYYIGIINSYGVSVNPSDEQVELAKKRSETCQKCEHIRYFSETSVKGEILGFIQDNFSSEKVKDIPTNYASCSACGCPLFAKVLANTDNPDLDCPLGKWNF